MKKTKITENEAESKTTYGKKTNALKKTKHWKQRNRQEDSSGVDKNKMTVPMCLKKKVVTTVTLPASYDIRSRNIISPHKKQKKAWSCSKKHGKVCVEHQKDEWRTEVMLCRFVFYLALILPRMFCVVTSPLPFRIKSHQVRLRLFSTRIYRPLFN